jgi:hypothetical protein
MQASTQGWHTEQWGTWGWIETGLKAIGLLAGVIGLVAALTSEARGSDPHVAGLILLVLLVLSALAQLGIRFMQRETISLLFAVANLIGHAALLIALLTSPNQSAWAVALGVFFVLGQLAKLQFLRLSGYTEGGADQNGMLRITGVVTLIYAAFTIFMLL